MFYPSSYLWYVGGPDPSQITSPQGNGLCQMFLDSYDVGETKACPPRCPISPFNKWNLEGRGSTGLACRAKSGTRGMQATTETRTLSKDGPEPNETMWKRPKFISEQRGSHGKTKQESRETRWPGREQGKGRATWGPPAPMCRAAPAPKHSASTSGAGRSLAWAEPSHEGLKTLTLFKCVVWPQWS